MLVDSHCHLDFLESDGDLDEIVGRARRAGVGRMLTICTRVDEIGRVRGIADRFDDVYCTVGIHPHEADSQPDTGAARLVDLAAHAKTVGIGECGLDYFYEHSPRDRQIEVFETHIEAARETGLPLVVHTRDADGDTAGLLREGASKGGLKGVIHCFGSGRELAETALEIGFYISFSGIVTFKKAEAVREVARTVPMDRILVETDAPYLAPVPRRGERNEPAFVAHTAECVAGLKAVSAGELARRTTDNFLRLFDRVPAQG